MTIRDLLIKYLLADTTIGGLVDTRIYPLRLPQATTPFRPAIVVTGISNLPIEKLKGPASADEPRFQIDSWATTLKVAEQVNDAVRSALEGYVGIWSDDASPSALQSFVQVRFITDRDFFEEDILGGLCRKSADYFVWNTRGAALVL